MSRQFEDRRHILEVKTPCLMTALSELNKPRYMSVSGVFDAYREKQVQILTMKELEDVLDPSNIGLSGSPTRVKQSFTKQPKGKGEKIETGPDEAVERIVNELAARNII